MDNQQWQDHIEKSISDAKIGKSWMNPKCKDIKGFSTPTMRHLFNNLLRFDGPREYWEIGLWGGGTFCSAISNQDNLWAFGWDDYSQPFGVDDIFQQLQRNVAEFAPQEGNGNELHVINQDFFEWIKSPDLQFSKFDVGFYDGEHSRESTAKALVAMYPNAKDTFIYIVDDAAWDTVHLGLWDSLLQLEDDIDIVKMWELRGVKKQDDSVWHNGVDILLCQKRHA